MLFGNYRRLIYLAQTDDPALDAEAARCAARLGLAYERRLTGYGDLAAALAGAVGTSASESRIASNAAHAPDAPFSRVRARVPRPLLSSDSAVSGDGLAVRPDGEAERRGQVRHLGVGLVEEEVAVEVGEREDRLALRTELEHEAAAFRGHHRLSGIGVGIGPEIGGVRQRRGRGVGRRGVGGAGGGDRRREEALEDRVPAGHPVLRRPCRRRRGRRSCRRSPRARRWGRRCRGRRCRGRRRDRA